MILAIALVVIGPEQMPVVLRALAKIIRELRAATNEAMRELTEALEEDESSKPKVNMPPRRPPNPPNVSEPPSDQSQQ
ncbi:MAG TPA: twin-arginine translocase TatA/TatE family subunit [Candidatus Binataceae bacterium]|nr:twin-arginine translocase TatA/TatE family subunit [Candidatus Binataceae bacterium]